MAEGMIGANFSGDVVDQVSHKIFSDLSGFMGNLPPELSYRVEGLITLLKAVGIAFIIYVCYLLVSLILNISKYKRMRRIEEKVNEIHEKLIIKKRSIRRRNKK